jgi:hypothetical protein
VAGVTSRFAIAAARFLAMLWPLEHLGADALVYPGLSIKDHARTAIQTLSKSAVRRVVFRHTGWRDIGGQMVYLHAGGAIGADGPVPGIEVRLPRDLERFVLPAPPTGPALMAAIDATLLLLRIAPERITIPLLATVFRAVLGETDFALHLAGPTGSGKTELAAAAQMHFGAGMNSRALPASWSSTGNVLEMLAFFAKDALLVVDDFAPSGSPADILRMHREAERLFRAQGNASGRQRLTREGGVRAGRPPRGLVLSTGEELPNGHSIRARALVIEVSKSDVSWPVLSTVQEAAADGLLSQTLAAFVQWAAPNYDSLRSGLIAERRRLRSESASRPAHPRTVGIVADLTLGLEVFARFACEVGTLTSDQYKQLLDRGRSAIEQAATAQGGHHAAADPVLRFRELLQAALASGAAHVAGADGEAPPQPGGWDGESAASTPVR